MKVWRIHTNASERRYNVYEVQAETQEEAMERYHNGEAEFIDSDGGDVVDEEFDSIECVDDLMDEDMKVDEGL
jgi:hypothetical protein